MNVVSTRRRLLVPLLSASNLTARPSVARVFMWGWAFDFDLHPAAVFFCFSCLLDYRLLGFSRACLPREASFIGAINVRRAGVQLTE
jgi:hypothetical protein